MPTVDAPSVVPEEGERKLTLPSDQVSGHARPGWQRAYLVDGADTVRRPGSCLGQAKNIQVILVARPIRSCRHGLGRIATTPSDRGQ